MLGIRVDGTGLSSGKATGKTAAFSFGSEAASAHVVDSPGTHFRKMREHPGCTRWACDFCPFNELNYCLVSKRPVTARKA